MHNSHLYRAPVLRNKWIHCFENVTSIVSAMSLIGGLWEVRCFSICMLWDMPLKSL